MLRGRLSLGQLKPLLPHTRHRCISFTPKRFQEEVDPLADFQNGVLPERESKPRQQIRQRSKIAFRRSEKPIRTLFYVPGSSLKMLEKAWQLEPDNITLDLEDSVSLTEKKLALQQVIETLKTKPKHPTAEVAVRINKRDSSPSFDELEQLAEVSNAIDAIVLPKYNSKGYIELCNFIERHFHQDSGNESQPKQYGIWGLVENPHTLVTLPKQLSYHARNDDYQHSKLRGMIFGAEDYSQVSGITRTPSLIELLYPRQRLVAVCRAWGLECLDLVSTNFRDMETLTTECQQGSQFGFTGKQAIHPTQIPVIHEAFSPSKQTVDHAERLLQKYIEEESGGKRGAWEFEGKMVDRPVITNAIRVLQLAVHYSVVPDKLKSQEILKETRRLADTRKTTNSRRSSSE